MTSIVNKVESKLDEYGVEIISEYDGDNNERIVSLEGMVIMIDQIKDELSISFYAGTRPDDAAHAILILKEISEIKTIYIMDSYILLDDKKIIQGDEAFNELKKDIARKAVKKHALENIYKDILLNCDNCPEC